MQFLSIHERRKGFTDQDYAGLSGQEMQRARELYSQGFIRQIWHRADQPGACLVWEADKEEQVRAMLDTLPFMQAGLVEIVLIPLKPYGGFAPTRFS
jgi:muconolactone delta-isomerase